MGEGLRAGRHPAELLQALLADRPHDPDLTLTAGASESSYFGQLFSQSSKVFQDRVWNGTIEYNTVPEPGSFAMVAAIPPQSGSWSLRSRRPHVDDLTRLIKNRNVLIDLPAFVAKQHDIFVEAMLRKAVQGRHEPRLRKCRRTVGSP